MHPRTLLSLLIAIVALLGIWAWLFVTGTIIVADSNGSLARAEVVTWLGARPLTRLPGGLWVGLPSGDGTVRLVCRDGVAREHGYVTVATHLWLKVGRGEGCPAIEAL
jgi:hypothetical protein